jgi:hypothetical protein
MKRVEIGDTVNADECLAADDELLMSVLQRDR